MTDPKQRPLAEVQVGIAVRVSSGRSEEAEFLQHLTRVGLALNTSVKVIEADAVTGAWRIEVGSGGDEQQRVTSAATADKVFVSQKD